MEIIVKGNLVNNADVSMTRNSCTEQAGDNCWLQLD